VPQYLLRRISSQLWLCLSLANEFRKAQQIILLRLTYLGSKKKNCLFKEYQYLLCVLSKTYPWLLRMFKSQAFFLRKKKYSHLGAKLSASLL
jgi:hypothetical protein